MEDFSLENKVAGFRVIILAMTGERSRVGQDWEQGVHCGPGLCCCIFHILCAHPQPLNCTSEVTCIYFAGDSVVFPQDLSFLIHLILFTLLSLWKLPSSDWHDTIC